MATSGSFNTSAVGNFYFSFEWSRTGYNSSLNEHYVHYTLYAHNSAGNYRTVYLKNLWVAGTQVFYEAGTSGNGKRYYEGDVVTSGDITIASSNSAGDGSFGASFEAGVGVYPSSNCSGSGSWDLDRIPRYANFTQHYVSGTSVTTISVHFDVDSTIDYVQYSLNNGNWTDTGVDISARDFTIGGLSPNSSYNVRTRIKRADSQLWTESGYIYGTTKDYAKVTGANDFNSSQNPYMTFNNPGGLVIDAALEFGGTNIMRYSIPNTGNYTFELTQAERDLLYSKCSSSNTLAVRYVIQSRLNGTPTWWSWADKTMYVVNSNPTFSNCTYEDTKAESLALTDDSSIFINNYNTLQVTVSTANKAVAKNGASMSRYRLVCGSNTPVEVNYSSSSNVVLTMNNIKSSSFTLYAIDSRGNSAKVDKTIPTANWKNYSNPVISSATTTRTGGVGSETTLTFSGTLWNNSFGSVTNAINSCTYKYKKTNESTYGSSTNITPTISGNNISFSSTIAGDEGADGFGITNSYNIRITLEDKIRTITYDVLLGTGKPAMAIAPGGVSFGLPYDTNLGGVCQIDGSRAIGQDVISAYVDRGSVTFSSQWQDVSVGSFVRQYSVGNKLTISNGKVKIGAGVSRVMAFAINTGFYPSTLGGDKCLHLQKNSTVVSDGSYYAIPQGDILPLYTQLTIIDVQENDLIGVSIMSGQTGTLNVLATYLYVQVIK